MDEIIAGFPLYTYYICFFFQFGIFPLLSVAYNPSVYKATFIGLMMKDWLVAKMDIAMSIHHVIGIWATFYFCNTQQISWIVSVGEFGSGVYNVYTLAKHYEFYVYPIYVGYSVIMTLTNIYCVLCIIRISSVRWYYKIPCLVLMVARQYFVYL